ncbi:MAG: branched-chain amino acid ABC transporter substrate-binding protein [Alphaproteobacteria bacterium]
MALIDRLAAAMAALPLLIGAASAQEIVVATVGPMTGQYAVFGDQLRRGAALAVEDINERGGVLGRRLKLEVGDDVCDPKQAVAVANLLAARKVAMVAGHYCSSSSIPASAVYYEANVLQISPASSAPALTDDAARKKWRNVFRTYGRDDAQGVFAGRYLAETFKGRKIAVVHDKSAYGKGLADETRKAMARGGLKEAMYEGINQGEKDFTALVTKMKRARIDAIYFGGYHTEAGLIVRQARAQGLKAAMISGDAVVTDEFWKIAGKAGEGTLMTFAPDPRHEPAAAAIVSRFRMQGYDPEGYTLYTYAAFQVWADAVAKAGSLRTADVAEALRGARFETVVGTIRFDRKGDVVNPKYVLYVWKDGKYAQKR